jgi:PAS domain S-box-containing protein
VNAPHYRTVGLTAKLSKSDMTRKRTYKELELRLKELEQLSAQLREKKDADRVGMISYRRLAEHLPGMVYRVHLRDNNRMEFYNRMVVSMTGYEAEELSHGEVCSIDPLILEEDRIGVIKTVKNAILENKPFEVEYRLRHKDGHIRYFLERGRPVYGSDGRPEFIDGIIMDNTDRKRSEHAFRYAHDELEKKVGERTVELESTVQALANEIEERKKMESELEKSHLRLQELSRKSLEALESDRRSVSKELHDGIGASLAAVKFRLEGTIEELAEKPDQAAVSLEKSIFHLLETIKETKRISANLRPLTLDDLGLMATIDWYTRQFSENYSGIRLIKQIEIREEEIPDLLKIVVYRLMQESLANAAKHSRADTVLFRLKKFENQLELELEDNGCGFDVQKVFQRADPLSGYGLESMQDRVKICGGSFLLDSQPGKGTHILVKLPLGGSGIQNAMSV